MTAELLTALLSATPFFELRLGIPWAMTFGGLSAADAYLWAVVGNVIAAVIGTLAIDPVVNLVRRYWAWADGIVKKIFAKTRTEHSHNFNRFGAAFLTFFVAIPIPGSGVYTGIVIAYLFGVSRGATILLTSIGAMLAGVAMLVITSGGIELFEWLVPDPHQLEVAEEILRETGLQ